MPLLLLAPSLFQLLYLSLARSDLGCLLFCSPRLEVGTLEKKKEKEKQSLLLCLLHFYLDHHDPRNSQCAPLHLKREREREREGNEGQGGGERELERLDD